jgi:hypothetical protein
MFLQKFDFVWAFSTLIHLSDETLQQALLFIRNNLTQSGLFFANVNAGDYLDKSWKGLPLVWRPMDFYDELYRRAGLMVSDFGSLSSHGHLKHEGNMNIRFSQRMLQASISDSKNR